MIASTLFFFTVGHSSDIVLMALSMERKARIIPVAGPAIDDLVAGKRWYVHTLIPVEVLYPGVTYQSVVPTIGLSPRSVQQPGFHPMSFTRLPKRYWRIWRIFAGNIPRFEV
jgi:TRAP-type uncharacterized transport system substrate-binding protein